VEVVRRGVGTQGSKYLALDRAFYLAPEVIRREDKECPAADIWSFACCVQEMLTCRYLRT
jgi:serine/threonine protein kinase